MSGVRFEDLHRGGWDPDARLADQDRDGVAAEIIYPTVGMMLCNHPDFDYKKACFDAYNRWIAEYCDRHPDRSARLRPDGRCARPPRGIEDLRAIKALGLRGVMMPGNPAVEDYDSPDLRPVLGGGDRARHAAVVPHPHHPRRAQPHARPAHQQLPVDHPRQPGHHGHADLRRRVRAPSEAARRLRRGRCRLGAALHVPHGPRLQAPPQLAGAGREARQAAERVLPRAHLHRRSRTTGSRSARPTR